jgi:lysyl-tRNA synthetase class 2
VNVLDIRQGYDSGRYQGPSGEPALVGASGRVVLVRTLSKKLTFLTLQDRDAKIQVALSSRHTPQPWDVVYVFGKLAPSNSGELTIWVDGFSLLARPLEKPPDKFHGITDKEIVYRQRYLDLICSEASREALLARSRIIAQIRRHLDFLDFVEIETPILAETPSGATARPFATRSEALHEDMYLRIATEVPLKKAIVGGLERVFEIGKVFRNEGIDRTHSPEFTSLELYQVWSGTPPYQSGQCLNDMKLLLRDLLREAGLAQPDELPEYEYDDIVTKHGVKFEEHMGSGVYLVTGYPLSDSPLCRARPDGKAARFEAFANSMEIANAYDELTDSEEQARRLAGANDDGLVQALRYGSTDSLCSPLAQNPFAMSSCFQQSEAPSMALYIELIGIATTQEERARGLQNAPALKPHQGMLFVYDQPQVLTFWMKDTLIPLDILFADADGVVQRIATMQPQSLKPASSGVPCSFALEVPAGRLRLGGVKPGDRLRLAPDAPVAILE